MATVLVTGATGNVGSALVRQLAGRGVEVLAGSTSGKDVAGVPGRAVDFRDPQSLVRAFAGVDRLFLLFPLTRDKLVLARNAVTAAKEAGVHYVLRSSGAGADVNAPAALGKLQGEVDAIIQDSGIPATILKPNNFMQNWVNYYSGMIKGGQVYMAFADGRVSWIDVRDIAAVATAILTRPEAHVGQSYTLTGPEALTTADVVARINAAAGTHASYIPVSFEQAQASMRSMGMDDWTIGIMDSLNRVVANGWAAATTDTVERLAARPAGTFAQFAQDHAFAWKS